MKTADLTAGRQVIMSSFNILVIGKNWCIVLFVVKTDITKNHNVTLYSALFYEEALTFSIVLVEMWRILDFTVAEFYVVRWS